jgi:hypothetical protein
MRLLSCKYRSVGKAAKVALLFLCLLACLASRAEADTPSQLTRVFSQGTNLHFAIADFDGDNRPDFATVQPGPSSSLNMRYWIGVQLSGGSRQTVGITAPAGGLQITSRDVNGDNFLDVVVTTAWTNRPVAVLLNDGHGNFTPSDPRAFPSVIQNSDAGWTCSTVEIRDAAAALLLRHLSGDCEEGSHLASPHSVTGLLFPWASRNSSFFTVVYFLGRAPPSIGPHF